MFSRANVCLVSSTVQHIGRAVFSLHPIVDLETGILASFPGGFVCPSEIVNGVVWILMVTAGFVYARYSYCHNVPFLVERLVYPLNLVTFNEKVTLAGVVFQPN
jgi:hypothetical protein